MLRKLPPHNRPSAVAEALLPEAQRVTLVSNFPLVSAGGFWSELLSPKELLHREVLPERAAVCVHFDKYLESHIRDGDDQVFRATLAELSKDGADALPLDMLERLAAEDRVISRNFVAP